MNSKTNLRDINSLKHYYSDGQAIWFACLVPDFDWFEKILSIKEIVEPVQTKIKKTTLMPSSISNSDKMLINKLKLNGIVRKYNFVIHTTNNYKVNLIVFEHRDKNIDVIMEHSCILSTDQDTVEQDFLKLVIETKSDINFEDDTQFNKDENFEIFSTAYTTAAQLYPEQVIKSHDKLKK